ncbi:MAG: hypothetical protein WBM99_11745 [Psychromonas sp.]
MKKTVELIDIGNDFTNEVKIIGVGKEGEAVVKHISDNRDISADFFVISTVTQDVLKVSSEHLSFKINALEQEQNGGYITSDFDGMERIIGPCEVTFFLFSIDDLAAIETVFSISKSLKNRGVLCGISSVLPNEKNTDTKLELLQQHVDFMLTIPTEESFNSTYITSAQLDLLADNYYKPIYALTRVMKDEVVSNCYDWAEFKNFANANKKAAFRYEVIRKKSDILSHYEDALYKIFNYESLININSMALKHVLVHITAGDNFRPDDYRKIGDELGCLYEKGVVCLMGISIEAEQPKDIIKVAILLIGRDLIKDGCSSFESEEICLEKSLPIPQFLIKR